ncbi:MAG TPA: carboxypeptidase-like regulatory domain-containing protein, partial [Thermoanaerobaculia bacterium]
AALALESTGARSRFGRSNVHAAMAAFPLGSAHVLARYQRRGGEARMAPGRTFRWWQDEALLSLAGLAGRRLRWDLQLTESWPWEGRPQTWGQLHLSWWIAKSTSLHALAAEGTFPGSGLYSLRLEHQLRPGLLLSMEYGDVPTFQPAEPADGDRLRVMVRKSWDVETPAAGAIVAGRVADPSGVSPGRVAVELGPYRALTDAGGRYAFRNLPGGSYELRVVEESLPAGYAALEGPRSAVVARGDRLDRDLAVAELGSAAGWVYVDRNTNRRRDPGEGIAGIVLLLDDRATTSGPDGAFGFHNVQPGTHRLLLDTGRLPDHLASTIPSALDLGLPPGRSLDHVELRLAEKRKAVVFQELRP